MLSGADDDATYYLVVAGQIMAWTAEKGPVSIESQ